MGKTLYSGPVNARNKGDAPLERPAPRPLDYVLRILGLIAGYLIHKWVGAVTDLPTLASVALGLAAAILLPALIVFLTAAFTPDRKDNPAGR